MNAHNVPLAQTYCSELVLPSVANLSATVPLTTGRERSLLPVRAYISLTAFSDRAA